jgi:hypothetical protein
VADLAPHLDAPACPTCRGPVIPFGGSTTRPDSGLDAAHVRCVACGHDWHEPDITTLARVWWSAGAWATERMPEPLAVSLALFAAAKEVERMRKERDEAVEERDGLRSMLEAVTAARDAAKAHAADLERDRDERLAAAQRGAQHAEGQVRELLVRVVEAERDRDVALQALAPLADRLDVMERHAPFWMRSGLRAIAADLRRLAGITSNTGSPEPKGGE